MESGSDGYVRVESDREMAERQGDFDVERVVPTPENVATAHGIDSSLPHERRQEQLVSIWDKLSDEEQTVLSEAGWV